MRGARREPQGWIRNPPDESAPPAEIHQVLCVSIVTHSQPQTRIAATLLMLGPLVRVRGGADFFESAPELEHRDIEIAKASRVSNDLDLRDLGVRERECQCPGQLAARRVDQSDRSID